jgi:hypothetical protein
MPGAWCVNNEETEMRGNGLIAAAALVLAALAPSLPANAVPYDFNDPTGDLGTDFTYGSAPPDGEPVTATGEDTRGPHLFGKNDPGNMGVGILGTTQSNGQINEITPSFYVQLDLINIPPPPPEIELTLAPSMPPATSARVGFRASGVDDGDVWAVFGTNTADIPRSAIFDEATFIASGSGDALIPDLGTDIIGVFRYLDITALSGGILVAEIDAAVPAAPEPASLAILGSALLTFGVFRFRRRHVL